MEQFRIGAVVGCVLGSVGLYCVGLCWCMFGLCWVVLCWFVFGLCWLRLGWVVLVCVWVVLGCVVLGCVGLCWFVFACACIHVIISWDRLHEALAFNRYDIMGRRLSLYICVV